MKLRILRAGAAISAAIKESLSDFDIWDLAVIVGPALVTVGVAMIYGPAGYIIGGVLLTAVGLLKGKK